MDHRTSLGSQPMQPDKKQRDHSGGYTDDRQQLIKGAARTQMALELFSEPMAGS